MNITFRQLRLFMALAETGSVSAAARLVHVTQPTASMGLKDITDAVGVPLYEVIARKVHLTQIGIELTKTARAIFGEWEAFEQQIDGIKGLTRGKLKVAVIGGGFKILDKTAFELAFHLSLLTLGTLRLGEKRDTISYSKKYSSFLYFTWSTSRF